MNSEKNKMLIENFWEKLNQNQFEIIDSLCADNIQARSHGISRSFVENKEEYKKEVIELFTAFPDYQLEIKDIIANNDSVWIYGMQLATKHATTKNFYGIPPGLTYNFEIAIFIIYKIKNGKIIHEQILSDTLQLYKNLGRAVLKANDKLIIKQYLEHLASQGLIPEKLQK